MHHPGWKRSKGRFTTAAAILFYHRYKIAYSFFLIRSMDNSFQYKPRVVQTTVCTGPTLYYGSLETF